MIPTRVDDLTVEWLTEAFDRTEHVTSVGAKPLGVGVGLVGQLYRLTLTWSGGDGPSVVIAKLAAQGAESRFVATVLNMYGREHGFYTELAQHTRLAHPHCYYSDHDPESQDSILILEDVSARGRELDQVAGTTLAEVGPAIDALAAFHAGWWDSPELERHDWLKRLADDPYPGAVAMAYSAGWPNIEAMYPEMCVGRVKALGDRYADLIPGLFAKLSEPPVVLAHADYRLDNLFLDADGVPIVVDWQLIDRSTGPRDLAYLVTQSLEIASRDEYRAAFDRYIAALRANGITVDEDWAFEQFRYGALLGFVYPVIAGGSLTISDPRHVELVRALLRRCVAALDALDAYDLPT
jgi:Ecdysteroid kinase-like family